MRERRALLGSEAAEKPVFGFLSGVASLCFAMLVLETVWIAFPANETHAVFFNGIVVFFLVADSLFDLYLRFRSPGKGMALRKLRTVVVLAALSYAVLSLLSRDPFPNMFIPNPLNIAGSIAIVFESYVVYGIRNILFSRNHLYSMLSHQGESENVMELFSANARMVFDAYDQARALQRSSMALFVVATGLILTNGYLLGIPFFVAFWYFMTLLSLFGLFCIANSYLDEHRFFAHGVVSPPRFQRIRQDWSYMTILVCVVVALLVSGDWSPLKPEDIAAFIAWIVSWFGKTDPQQLENIQETVNRFILQPPLPAQDFAQTLNQEPNLFWPVFFEIVKWLSVAAAVAFAMYFLIRPLLSKEFKIRASLALFMTQLGRFLIEPFKAFGVFVRSLLGWRPRSRESKQLKHKNASPSEYIKAMLKGLGSSKSGRGRIGIRSLEIYAELLEWLYDRHVRWSLSDTPYDIVRLAGESFSRTAETDSGTPSQPTAKALDIDAFRRAMYSIADILEKDLFSGDAATPSDLDRMNAVFQDLRKDTKRDG